MNTRLCPKCNKEIQYKSKKLYDQAQRRNSICKSCRTTIANKSPNRFQSGENNPFWKGYKDVPASWFTKYFSGSGKSRRKRFGNITTEDVYNLWIAQDKKCALSNLPIDFNHRPKYGTTCSLDRIDSKKEYTIDNVQLVHKDVNLMKNYFCQNYFIYMCRLIHINHSHLDLTDFSKVHISSNEGYNIT